MDVAELGGLRVGGGEPQATRLQRLDQQFRQTRFEEGHLAGGQALDLPLIDVDTEYLEAQHGHADGVRGAEVARADDGESRVAHR
jgi:hypothetical protein